MSTLEQKEENVVRSVLKSEITWFVFLIAGVMGFVSSVILPLQRIQIQITQIQENQIEQKIAYEKFDARVHTLEEDHIRLIK